jgi:N-acyl-D-aspartate/D-glutamate deacylase
MLSCDILIRQADVIDGSGTPRERLDVALQDGRICAIAPALELKASTTVDARGLVLAPGFIDVHTHDDISVIRNPAMLPKLSQGVTTVIVGNCGISAAPVKLSGELPEPMNLLGLPEHFCYPTFAAYAAAIRAARPAVNVAALVGHTALRNNHMNRLDRSATPAEIAAMRAQLREALDNGALGLSTGLAYLSANAATTEEVVALAEPLAQAGAIYTTHMRTEADAILDAMHEAFEVARLSNVPVIVSHLKCAGVANWICVKWTKGWRSRLHGARRIRILQASRSKRLRKAGAFHNWKRRGACNLPGLFIAASQSKTCSGFWRIPRR